MTLNKMRFNTNIDLSMTGTTIRNSFQKERLLLDMKTRRSIDDSNNPIAVFQKPRNKSFTNKTLSTDNDASCFRVSDVIFHGYGYGVSLTHWKLKEKERTKMAGQCEGNVKIQFRRN